MSLVISFQIPMLFLSSDSLTVIDKKCVNVKLSLIRIIGTVLQRLAFQTSCSVTSAGKHGFTLTTNSAVTQPVVLITLALCDHVSICLGKSPRGIK